MSRVVFRAGDFTFEWDRAKALANRRKHGVSFEEAATVFADPLAIVFDDPTPSNEPRFLILGQSFAERRLLVAHVERGDTLRLISARAATRHEQSLLERRQ